eukprot:748714-Hanusia_phi.AAC.5
MTGDDLRGRPDRRRHVEGMGWDGMGWGSYRSAWNVMREAGHTSWVRTLSLFSNAHQYLLCSSLPHPPLPSSAAAASRRSPYRRLQGELADAKALAVVAPPQFLVSSTRKPSCSSADSRTTCPDGNPPSFPPLLSSPPSLYSMSIPSLPPACPPAPSLTREYAGGGNGSTGLLRFLRCWKLWRR